MTSTETPTLQKNSRDGNVARRWPAAGLLVGGSLAFAAVAADILYHGTLYRWDRPIHIFFHEHATFGWTLACSAFSGLGELVVIIAVGLVVGIPLAVRKKWRTAAIWTLALAGSGVLNLVFKNLFRVPRPGEFTFYVFKPDAGYSFPSGHTMAVAITTGALALVLAHQIALPPARRWLLALAVLLISLLEAFALLYIGVHYLTDVLAGLAVSAAWLGIIRWLLPPAQYKAGDGIAAE